MSLAFQASTFFFFFFEKFSVLNEMTWQFWSNVITQEHFKIHLDSYYVWSMDLKHVLQKEMCFMLLYISTLFLYYFILYK